MLKPRRTLIVMALVGLWLGVQGCATSSPVGAIDQHDHAALVNFYKQQAQEMREKAKVWNSWAEYYEAHQEPHGKTEAPQHAAHCRSIAKSFEKAAEEADALVTEHRRQLPHGMVN